MRVTENRLHTRKPGKDASGPRTIEGVTSEWRFHLERQSETQAAVPFQSGQRVSKSLPNLRRRPVGEGKVKRASGSADIASETPK